MIREQEGVGYQHIGEADDWTLTYLPLADILAKGNALASWLEDFALRPFDLSVDVPRRVVVITLGEREHLLAAGVHHIAFDGWSVAILVAELVELYRSRQEERPARLTPLPVQYADYALWQRQYLSGDRLQEKLDYWQRQLRGVEVLSLPTDYERPASVSTRGRVVSRMLDREMRDGLVALSQQQGVTLFMTLLAAFQVLLARYTDQQDICTGTAMAGRPQHEVEGLIGFFINTLALRSRVDGSMAFGDFLQQVKQMTLAAYAHQEVPFEKIVEALDIPRDLNRNPIVQVMFTLQNMPEAV